MPDNIYSYIKQEEIRYGQEIEVLDNWSWCMKDHVRNSLLMKHGKFLKATNTLETKNPKRNIVYPLLNLRYRTEDINMKEVRLYVDDPDQYHLSFLVKKYHDEVYVPEHDLDTFFDQATEEKIDLGGVLVRKGKDGPVLETLESIAFCDQTDMLSGPIGFKMFFSPDELYAMEAQGWGATSNGATITLDELVTLADEAKQQDTQKGVKTKTPGKYIEAYRVHGSLPTSWLPGHTEQTDESKERYVRQIFIGAFYKDKKGFDIGVTLYHKREYTNPFKVHLSGKKIRNRALAMGGIEELVDAQVWTDYSEIRKKDMLDAASKTVFQTSDDSYSSRNQIKDMDNLEITVTQANTRIEQVPTNSPNIQLFSEWLNEWHSTAQTTSGATPALMGTAAPGTAARLQALVTQQSQALHDYRKGQFATFIAEVYTDWIIPDIQRQITQGATFLATLSQDEMEYVADCVVRHEANTYITDQILSGQVVDQTQVDTYKQKVRQEFARGGNKRFLEILKGEFNDLTLGVKVDVAGKQKDLAAMSTAITGIWKFIFSTYNPQTGKFGALEDPKALKAIQKLSEYAGLDPIDFGYATTQPQAPQGMQPPVAAPAARQQPMPSLPQPQMA